MTILIKAIYDHDKLNNDLDGYIATIITIIREHPEQVNLIDEDNNGSPLIEVINCLPPPISSKLIKILVAAGANVNYQNDEDMTALMYYVCDVDKEPNINIIKFLVDFGADVYLKSDKDSNAYDYCEWNSVKKFMKNNYYQDYQEPKKNDGRNDITRNMIQDNFTKFKEAIAFFPELINKRDNCGYYPVDISYKLDIKYLETLIAAGLNVKKYESILLNCINNDFSKNCIKKIEILINEGANINEKTYNKYTPVMIAIKNDKTDVAKFLIEQGCDLNYRIPSISALSLAKFSDMKNLIRSKLLI